MATSLLLGAGSPKRPSFQRMESLPQHGFAADLSFANLVKQNPFLFRVYTPKSRGPHNRDPFFVGAKFGDDDESSFSDVELDGSDTNSDAGSVKSLSQATYTDAIRHLDWTKRSSSPYISTSFSFAWAIWEASRRYQDGVKHDVHIAVIDARALVGRATTALELLRQGTSKVRHRDHAKFCRFASESQDVLVFGCIPSTAILSSVPLTSVLPKVPSYFAPEAPVVPSDKTSSSVLTPPPSPTPFNVVFKDHKSKPSYKQFCQDLSDRFLRGTDEDRLQDTSANAVRLAITLLRPWLHRSFPQAEVEDVASTVSELSLLIAQWPAQLWARDRAELEGLVRRMVHVVAEEVKETRRAQALKEVERLQGIVADLQRTTDSLEHKQTRAQPSQTGRLGSQLPPPYSASWITGPPPLAPKPVEQEYSLPPMASALISGLLFGSFCMLSVISSQRWELANQLT